VTPSFGEGFRFEEALRFFLQKASIPTERWTDVWERAHARHFMVAGAAAAALLDDIRGEVVRAIEGGSTLGEFTARFGEIARRHGWAFRGEPGWRARVIYQTNLAMAYSAGRYAQMTAPEALAAFPYWQYRHSGAKHPRLHHLAWDGLVLRADDPFWSVAWPPNGFNCGCWVRGVSVRQLARMGKPGPDRAPVLDTWTERNPKTGETFRRIEGIDKGFGYNVGEAWLGPPRIPDDVAARLPPLPVAPPAPGADVPLPFADASAGDAILGAATRDWRASLTPAEIRAVTIWRREGRQINEVLRRSDAPDAIAPVLEALDAALARARAPRALVLWRGVKDLTFLRGFPPGTGFPDPGYVSGSIQRGVARRNARRGGHVVEIRVPAGYPAAYVARVGPDEPRQYEVLLPRGAHFRVVEAGDRIVLEVVP
jgi:hypothetical protein